MVKRMARREIDDEAFSDEDRELLSKDEFRRDPVTGRKEKRSVRSVLNKKALNKHEMDEFFLDF